MERTYYKGWILSEWKTIIRENTINEQYIFLWMISTLTVGNNNLVSSLKVCFSKRFFTSGDRLFNPSLSVFSKLFNDVFLVVVSLGVARFPMWRELNIASSLVITGGYNSGFHTTEPLQSAFFNKIIQVGRNGSNRPVVCQRCAFLKTMDLTCFSGYWESGTL